MIDSAAAERPAWLERENRLERSVKIGVFAIVIFAVVYPFLSVLATSLASEPDVIKNGGLVIWPEHPTFNAYRTIFAGGVVTRAITVSMGFTPDALGKVLASATYRLRIPHTRFSASTTDAVALDPMRHDAI